jgi:hypothetical protein
MTSLDDPVLVEKIVEVMAGLARQQVLVETGPHSLGSAGPPLAAIEAAEKEIERLTSHLSKPEVEALFRRADAVYAQSVVAMLRAAREHPAGEA